MIFNIQICTEYVVQKSQLYTFSHELSIYVCFSASFRKDLLVLNHFILPLRCDVCSAAAGKPPPPLFVPGCWLCLGNVRFFLRPSLGESLTPWRAQRIIQYQPTLTFLKQRLNKYVVVVMSLTVVPSQPLVHWDQPIRTNQVPSPLQQSGKPKFPESRQNKAEQKHLTANTKN